eukprot:Nk52_evm42s1737 gene=Nk52_evmTU42s1737
MFGKNFVVYVTVFVALLIATSQVVEARICILKPCDGCWGFECPDPPKPTTTSVPAPTTQSPTPTSSTTPLSTTDLPTTTTTIPTPISTSVSPSSENPTSTATTTCIPSSSSTGASSGTSGPSSSSSAGTPSSSAVTSCPPESPSEGGLSTVAIAGIAVGASIAFIALVVIGIVLCLQRRKKLSAEASERRASLINEITADANSLYAEDSIYAYPKKDDVEYGVPASSVHTQSEVYDNPGDLNNRRIY